MRTHYCGDLTKSELGKTIRMCGWVHYRRDLGGLIFLEIRDRTGFMQVVFSPQVQTPALFTIAEQLRKEYVVCVTGVLRLRPEGTENTQLSTGTLEMYADELEVLNTAQTLPFTPDDHQAISEELRLQYRYIDLRRPEAFARLAFRSKAVALMRGFLDEAGFLDIETPILTKATPEAHGIIWYPVVRIQVIFLLYLNRLSYLSNC